MSPRWRAQPPRYGVLEVGMQPRETREQALDLGSSEPRVGREEDLAHVGHHDDVVVVLTADVDDAVLDRSFHGGERARLPEPPRSAVAVGDARQPVPIGG